MEENKIDVEQIMELLSQRKFYEIRDILSEANPIDVATLLGEVPQEKLLLLYRMLPKVDAADVFSEMDPEEQEALIRAFNDREIREVLEEMYIDDAVDLVEEMPAIVVNKILRLADSETRKEINELLKYPEDSAGSIMTTEYVRLEEHMTVEDAFKRIRAVGVDKEIDLMFFPVVAGVGKEDLVLSVGVKPHIGVFHSLFVQQGKKLGGDVCRIGGALHGQGRDRKAQRQDSRKQQELPFFHSFHRCSFSLPFRPQPEDYSFPARADQPPARTMVSR